jgi:exonuclease III
MRVKSYYQFSDRISRVILETKPKDTIVVQVYMPTSDYEDDEIEEMYDSIEEVIKTIRRDENLIVLGNWNMVKEKGTIGARK